MSSTWGLVILSKVLLILCLGVLSISGGESSSTLAVLQERGYTPSSEKEITSGALTYHLYKLPGKVALVDTITSKSSSVTFMIILKGDTIEELVLLDVSKGYGDRIDNRFWLKQFKELKVAKVNKGVDAISGATLVSDDIKEGVIAVAQDYLKK